LNSKDVEIFLDILNKGSLGEFIVYYFYKPGITGWLSDFLRLVTTMSNEQKRFFGKGSIKVYSHPKSIEFFNPYLSFVYKRRINPYVYKRINDHKNGFYKNDTSINILPYIIKALTGKDYYVNYIAPVFKSLLTGQAMVKKAFDDGRLFYDNIDPDNHYKQSVLKELYSFVNNNKKYNSNSKISHKKPRLNQVKNTRLRLIFFHKILNSLIDNVEYRNSIFSKKINNKIFKKSLENRNKSIFHKVFRKYALPKKFSRGSRKLNLKKGLNSFRNAGKVLARFVEAPRYNLNDRILRKYLSIKKKKQND